MFFFTEEVFEYCKFIMQNK